MGRYVARNTVKQMLKGGVDVARSRVGVMGITFKENCPDVRNSKVVDLVRELADHGVEVVVTDPTADPGEVQREYGITLSEIAPASVDALIVAVGHRQYRVMTPPQLKAFVRGELPLLFDVKSLFDRHEALAQGFRVFRL